MTASVFSSTCRCIKEGSGDVSHHSSDSPNRDEICPVDSQCARKLNCELAKLRLSLEEKIVSSRNRKAFYRFCKRQLKISNRIGAIVGDNGEVNSFIAEEWRTNMLKVHNENRRKLAKGNQKGEGGVLLPTAKNMKELIWHCWLEDAAHEEAAKCTKTVLPPIGFGAVSSMITTKANPCDAMSTAARVVHDIWKTGAEKQASNQKVAGNDDFSQMAYYRTDGIGCSYSWCDGKLSLVCLYSENGAANSVKDLYAKGGAGDTCKSCEPYNNQENCVNGLCQASLFYVLTTSTICPGAISSNAVWGTDDLRIIALNMHNYYRRQLAMGWAKDKQITYAKAAAAMPELTYDCDIEEEIMDGLVDCPGKPVTTKSTHTHNYKAFKPYNSPVDKALQKIAFHQTRKVGCGIKVCNREGRIEVQCGYVMDE
ncbi:SCP-like protein [Ancylostoma ceylanicum]|uniref:SCP-like protein n=1 Tax=Ancylostoma ceylanicum TaxID=53326 RepID=A0A0D6L746_9BILA|nr:SCP-like protein [Ancylostoma ceylanicum]